MATEQSSASADHTAKAIVLIRILAGWVFLSEGIQKFLFPETLGAWPLRQDRNSFAERDGSVWRRRRNRVRHPASGWSDHEVRGRSASRCDLGRFVFDQDRHICESRVLEHAA
jgi:hypothetical protein